MAARRYMADEVAEIVMNLPFDGDESELSDFEGSEGDEGDVTLNDQDELDEFSDESDEEANNEMEDNTPFRLENVLWSQRDEQTVHQYHEFTACHGPTQLLGIDAEPVDFFDLLFPEQLWTLISQETNKYRLQRGVSQWDNDTNIEEIRAFHFFISFHLFIRHKGYKREKKMKKVLLFTISWRGSPKEASRLIENGLPQINK